MPVQGYTLTPLILLVRHPSTGLTFLNSEQSPGSLEGEMKDCCVPDICTQKTVDDISAVTSVCFQSNINLEHGVTALISLHISGSEEPSVCYFISIMLCL